MNNSGFDFFESRRPFKFFSVLLLLIFLLAVLCFLIVHVAIIVAVYNEFFVLEELFFRDVFIVMATSLMNIAGFLYIVGMGIPFAFDEVVFNSEEQA